MSEDEVLKLRARRLRAAREVAPEEVEGLLDVAFQNPVLSDFLLRDLKELRNPAAIEELCRHAMRNSYPAARMLAIEEGYLPANQHDQAVFLYVTRQWEKYQQLDPDRQLLKKVYANTSKETRQQIVQAGRRSGRTDIINIVINVGRAAPLVKSLVEQQQEVTRLVEQRDWSGLWQNVFICQPTISAWCLQILQASGWQPQDADQLADFQTLTTLAQPCREEVLNNLLQAETATIQNFHTGQERYFGAKFSPDGRVLALIRENGLEFFDIIAGTSSGMIAGVTFDSFQQNRTGQLAFSSDSRFLACCSVNEASYTPEYGVSIVDVEQRKVVHKIGNLYASLPAMSTLRRDEAPVLAFAGTDMLLILAKNRDDASNILKVFNVAEKKFLGVLEGVTRYSSYVHEDLTASPSGELLAEYNSAGELYLWSVISRELLGRVPKPRGLRSNNNHLLAFNPDGRTLAYVMRVNQVHLIDVVTGQENEPFANLVQDKVPTSLCFSHDGLLMAIGNDNCTISLRRVSDATLLKQLKIESGGWLTDLVFAPQNNRLTCLTDFGLVRSWSLNLLAICQSSSAVAPQEAWIWLKEAANDSTLSDTERYWLRFLEELFGWRWRYAVEVEDSLDSVADEFDIELDPEQH